MPVLARGSAVGGGSLSVVSSPQIFRRLAEFSFSLALGHLDDERRLVGNVQHAVLVCLQHVEDTALARLLCQAAGGGEGLVLGVLEFHPQLVNLQQALLAAVAVGYIYYDKECDEEYQPYLPAQYL